ncbi:unnamed protein product, partial [Allacma fusca]
NQYDEGTAVPFENHYFCNLTKLFTFLPLTPAEKPHYVADLQFTYRDVDRVRNSD